MAPLLSIISPEKIFMWLRPCFIYTNDEEVRVCNRPTVKRNSNYTISTSPKTELARPECCLFKSVILGAR